MIFCFIYTLVVAKTSQIMSDLRTGKSIKIFVALSVLFALGINACASSPSPTTTPSATPDVVATAWVAEIYGKLVEADGCLKVVDQNNQSASYTLIWPPDVSASITDETVNVTFGLVTGNQRNVVLHIGENVHIGGGETEKLTEQLQQSVPANCNAPYWVVGKNIEPLRATDEPK
jgi:hypothetical protein